jgi:cysteine-rich repeat protein
MLNFSQLSFRTMCLIVLISVGANAQTPVDIQRIDKVYSVISAEKDPSAIIESFAQMMHSNAVDLAKKHGVYNRGQFDSDAFTDFVEDRAKAIKRDAELSDRVSREKALYTQLISLSTQNAAHAIVDAWLGLPGAKSLVKPAPTVAVASMGKQITMASTDRRLTVVLPNADQGKTQKEASKKSGLFGSFKKAVGDINPMKSDDEKPVVLIEHGGPGSGNGIIDAGEWVQVNFKVQNNGSTPFFSSSGWLSEDHVCAWAPSSGEIEFPELPAKSKDAEKVPTASIGTWIYLSSSCSDKTVVSLNLKVKDTHRAMSRAIQLKASLKVTKRPGGVINQLSVDGDIPGHSDGGKKPPIRPDLRLELAHGLSTGYTAKGARMNWGIDKGSASLLVKNEFRADAPLYKEGFSWRAADDLDIQAKPEDDFYDAVNSIIKKDKWTSKKDAQVWFATDTEVVYASPDGPTIIRRAEKKQKEICDNYQDDDGDGKPDCLDTDCKDAKFCKNRKACPNVSTVIGLAKANASIVASPASTKLKNAIAAVQPNYELVYNDAQFSTRYACLLQGIPLSKCGQPKCPDCAVEKKVEAVKMVDEETERHVRYVYRNYLGLDLSVGKEKCKDRIDNDLDGRTDSEDSDCGVKPFCGDGRVNQSSESCDDGNRSDGDGCDRLCRIESKPEPEPEPEPEVHQWIIDVGYSTRAQVDAEDDTINLDEDVAGAGFKIQASYNYFTGGISFHGYSFTGDYVDSTDEFNDEGEGELVGSLLSLSAGVGKLIDFDALQIHPRAQVGYFVRDLERFRDMSSQTRAYKGSGLGFGVGLALRYQFSEILGVYGELDFLSDGAVTERSGNDYSDGGSTQFGLGLSIFL